ncbi:putative nuclease HARBI1, partial [Leptidea sinapis]|uniref:putative nuclease HARBI1 n=1 Tax=Leptidea sinapis TaxID=189913 RepID=UPI0021C49416
HLFRVPRSTTSNIISEVCDAIYNALRDYIKVPSGDEWKRIEKGFRNSWNFPGCSGAIDGKHVTVKAPPNAGSYYFNYKKNNSIVLMAVADDDYCFSYIDVGCNGRVSDGGVFSHCDLSHALENNLLPEGLVLVADNAFPLKPYMVETN